MDDCRATAGWLTTPRQLLLIGLLGVILAGMLIVQLGGAPASGEGCGPAPATPAAAEIGDRTVRVGDVIEGYRVESVDPSGVVLVPSVRENVRR